MSVEIVQVRRRRSLWLAGAVALVVTLATATWWWQRDSDGGLPHKAPTTTYTFDAMDASNTAFTIGSFPLEGEGKDLEVLDVRPLTSRNLEVIGMDAVWPTDSRSSGALDGSFPPAGTHTGHPLFGVVVPASEFSFVPKGDHEAVTHVLVEIGFRMSSPQAGEVAALNGVTVKYRVGGVTKTQLFRQAAIACVKPNPCGKKPNGLTDDKFADRVLKQLGLVRG